MSDDAPPLPQKSAAKMPELPKKSQLRTEEEIDADLGITRSTRRISPPNVNATSTLPALSSASVSSPTPSSLSSQPKMRPVAPLLLKDPSSDSKEGATKSLEMTCDLSSNDERLGGKTTNTAREIPRISVANAEVPVIPAADSGGKANAAREVPQIPVANAGSKTSPKAEVPVIPVTDSGGKANAAREIPQIPVANAGSKTSPKAEVTVIPVTDSGGKANAAREVPQIPVVNSVSKTITKPVVPVIPVTDSGGKANAAREVPQIPVANSVSKTITKPEVPVIPVTDSGGKANAAREVPQIPVANAMSETTAKAEVPVIPVTDSGGKTNAATEVLAIPRQVVPRTKPLAAAASSLEDDNKKNRSTTLLSSTEIRAAPEIPPSSVPVSQKVPIILELLQNRLPGGGAGGGGPSGWKPPPGARLTPFASLPNASDAERVPSVDKQPNAQHCTEKVSPEPRTPRSLKRGDTDRDASEEDAGDAAHEDGGCESEDFISEGEDLNSNDPEFFLPSTSSGSIPIIANQPHLNKDKKGFLFKYTSLIGKSMNKVGDDSQGKTNKFSDIQKRWQKRWVTVDEHSFKYYSSSKSSVSKRIIPICTVKNVEQDIKMADTHPFRFRLWTNYNKVFYFAADNVDDLSLWTSIFMRAILDRNMGDNTIKVGGDMHSPDIMGYVKMDRVRNRRYLAIKKEKFCYYETENDFKHFSPIHEVELQLANVKDIGKCRLQMNTPQVSFVFIFEIQDELNVWKSAFESGISYALGDDKVLEEVYQNQSNTFCADCGADAPEWAAINLGMTLCQNCAGLHRKMANAKIRSLRMDSKVWTPSLVKLMLAIGNKNANMFWEYKIKREDRIEPEADVTRRSHFIQRKYEEKSFCQLHPMHGQQTSKLNEQLLKCVQKSDDVLLCMQLVFSGAQISNKNNNNCRPHELAQNENHPLQAEFLSQNSHDINLSSSSSFSSSDVALSSPVRRTGNDERSSLADVTHSGNLLKTGANPKGAFNKRWFTLQNGCLTYHDNEKNCNMKDSIDQKDMWRISSSYDERVEHCFELGTCKAGGRSYILAAETADDKQLWMSKLAQVIFCGNMPEQNNNFCTQEWSNFSRGGIVFLKQSSTSQDWRKTWIHVCGRTLFVFKDIDQLEEIDLRKVACIKYISSPEKSQEISDDSPSVFMDLSNNRTLYIRSNTPKETEAWHKCISNAMTKPGSGLNDQVLTVDDVPMIVHKCVTFITNHGLQTDGIYRRSGQVSIVTKLYDAFLADARAVFLKPDDYEIHVIAMVLKRFFQNLDEPVLTKAFHDDWINVSRMKDAEEKMHRYKQLLLELPGLNYCTLRYILSHLIKVSKEEAKNRMNISNLSDVFGPVLVSCSKEGLQVGGYEGAIQENAVVRDLLENHQQLFQFQDGDAEQDKKMEDAINKIQRLNSSRDGQDNQNDDIMLPLYVNSKHGTQVSLKIPMCMKAEEVRLQVMENARLSNKKKWTLYEVVCNDELERPIHENEKVFEMVLNWAKWPREFSGNNYLVIKENPLLHLSNPTSSLCGEMKYASKKDFKKYSVELLQGSLNFKNSSKPSKVEIFWKTEELFIYAGIQQKRNPPTKWGFTFIPVKQLPVSPYFGHSVCCSNESEINRWLLAMYKMQHPVQS